MLQKASTGISGLDDALNSLQVGDNVVWQVDSIDDFLYFVKPYIDQAKKEKRKIIYIRFAAHKPILTAKDKVKVHTLDPKVGFESFAKKVHEIITKEGVGAYYVFDCLSDLLLAWATDLMIGNFFMVTCPYLFKLDTIAYFSILRDRHSFKTIARIRETTQLLLDVYNFESSYYVHPLKVWNRYSPTMFLPHLMRGDKFLPVISSDEAARLFAFMSANTAERAKRRLDFWDRLFIEAEDNFKQKADKARKKKIVDQICDIMIGREKKMLDLVKKNFTLEDLLQVKQKVVGTGFIGGKAVGMLLARKILMNDLSFDWKGRLEPHDSFYVGSDVFYSYIVQNGWWEEWLEHKKGGSFFKSAAELKEKMLKGTFPEEIREQFYQIIEYFGQAPIIVRSSSLLEDGFGNAFAGKYESIFVANQGTPEARYARIEEVIRQVFASTLSEDALTYRLQRGLSHMEEQMALLIQRVSGEQRKRYFFPYLAGVGVSSNPFVWNKDIDPKAGMVRLVMGLGTRAVGRAEGDYSRVVALDRPKLKPYAGEDEAKFSQHDIDLLDIKDNEQRTLPISKLLGERIGLDMKLIGVPDHAKAGKLKALGIKGEDPWVLTFDGLFDKTPFIKNISMMLKRLESEYKHPVDVEFTVNIAKDGGLGINLVQCRPLQAMGTGKHSKIPAKIPRSNTVFASKGNFMGGNVTRPVSRIIFVDPEKYSELIMSKKYEVARIIGKLNKMIGERKKYPAIIIGPGRWGTRDATLGVPVSFAEINNFSALIEVDDPERGFMPELSFASHFFLDLVEAKIFYAALFRKKEEVFLDILWLNRQDNAIGKILPEAEAFIKVIRVIDPPGRGLELLSDIVTQQVVLLKSKTD